MKTHKVQFFRSAKALTENTGKPARTHPANGNADVIAAAADMQPSEPTTCQQAEPYALRVLDDSMEPEFRRGCLIIIDPTGHAKHGSFVLVATPDTDIPAKLANAPGATENSANSANSAKSAKSADSPASVNEAPLVFRQLLQLESGGWQLVALNQDRQIRPMPIHLKHVEGVIVQRAGFRRRYHKHYA